MKQEIEHQKAQTAGDELRELFFNELTDLFNAEQQLTKALPRMAAAAVSDDLRATLEAHLKETLNQITRLEDVFNSLDEPVQNKECKGMKGLLEAGKDLTEEMKGSSALDAALIAAAQKVEHYEIASYGTLCVWAEMLGCDEAVELLSATLDEEISADGKLSEIAESLAIKDDENQD